MAVSLLGAAQLAGAADQTDRSAATRTNFLGRESGEAVGSEGPFGRATRTASVIDDAHNRADVPREERE